MNRKNISELIPGMITAEDVYSYNNQLILPKGTVLTDKSITKLEFYSIYSVRIEEEKEPLSAPVPEDEPYSARVKRSEEFINFKQDFEEDVDEFKDFVNDIVEKNSAVDFQKMLNNTLSLLHPKDGTRVSIFDMLHNMREYDDLTFTHSINVALICNVFATWLGLSDEEVELATSCGLFHDIGKLAIPDSIIKKPAKLTDMEYKVIQTHPLEGYKLLADYPIDDRIKKAALSHHERCDGSGYPSRLKSNQLDFFTKMVSIADVYDAMTSARIYRGPLCPFTVIYLFEQEGMQKYDTRLILTFLQHIVTTYLLNDVRLNDGTVGKVIYINMQQLSQPVIKCGGQFIDLSTRKDLYIEALL